MLLKKWEGEDSRVMANISKRMFDLNARMISTTCLVWWGSERFAQQRLLKSYLRLPIEGSEPLEHVRVFRNRGSMATVVDRSTNATAQTVLNCSEHTPSSWRDCERLPEYLNSYSRSITAKSRWRRRRRQLGKRTRDRTRSSSFRAGWWQQHF